MTQQRLLVAAAMSCMVGCAADMSDDDLVDAEDPVEADVQSEALAASRFTAKFRRNKNDTQKLCIGVDGGKTSNGAYIRQFNCEDAANQRWVLESVGNSLFTIENRNSSSNKCMGLDGGRQAPNTDVRLFECDGRVNQRWRVGNNRLQTFDSSLDLCLGVDGGSGNHDAQLKIFKCDGRANQTWELQILSYQQ